MCMSDCVSMCVFMCVNHGETDNGDLNKEDKEAWKFWENGSDKSNGNFYHN